MNYITLRRHGVNDYFTIEGTPANVGATLQGSFLEIDTRDDSATWSRANSQHISKDAAREIRNGIVTPEAAQEIEKIFEKIGVPVQVGQYVRSYFVGAKWQCVNEWTERQKNDRDIITRKDPLSPKFTQTFDVTEWTLEEAARYGVTASDALEYPVTEYDTMLSDVAALKPQGSFSAFCHSAHFKRKPESTRSIRRAHTVSELAEIV